jgi:hypothetical protein
MLFGLFAFLSDFGQRIEIEEAGSKVGFVVCPPFGFQLGCGGVGRAAQRLSMHVGMQVTVNWGGYPGLS